MQNGLTWMQKENKFCDVTLKIGRDRKLRAHRVVLALSSRYFEALLDTKWEEGRSEEVELLGFDENAVTNLVRFAYSGSIDITKDNVKFLLEAANYLGIEFVQKACTGFILDEDLDTDTCLGALQIADMFALEPLREEAKRYALRHFTEVSMKQDFVNLPFQLLSELLGSESLRVVIDDLIPSVEERERVVLQAVFCYVKHDPLKRSDYLPQLLSLVRLPTLSKRHLEEIATDNLIASCRCRHIFDNALQAKRISECGTDSGSEDSNWAKSRDFAKCVVTWGPSFAVTQQDLPQTSVFTDKNVLEDADSMEDLSEGVYISEITVWAQYLEAKQFVSGLEVSYSNTKKKMYGVKTAVKQNEIRLKENERFVKVEVQASTVVNALTFYTNKRTDRNMKIYGGSHVRMEQPIGWHGFLSGVAGAIVDFHGHSAITRLQFAWRTFFLNDEMPIFEHLIGKCEICDKCSECEGDDKGNDDDDDDDDDDDYETDVDDDEDNDEDYNDDDEEQEEEDADFRDDDDDEEVEEYYEEED